MKSYLVIFFCVVTLCLAQDIKNYGKMDQKCTGTANRAWGSGYVGPIIFRATECYNSSYTAVTAVANVGYYCGNKYLNSNCKSSGIWMEFTNGPVRLNWISWDEGAGKEGGKISLIGVTNNNNRFDLGCNLSAGTRVKPDRFFASKKFRYIGLMGERLGSCVEYDNSGGYYLSIKNLRFSVYA